MRGADVPRQREESALRLVVQRLTDAYSGRYGEELVQQAVYDAYRKFDAVRLRDFVPLLIERRVRRQFREAEENAS